MGGNVKVMAGRREGILSVRGSEMWTRVKRVLNILWRKMMQFVRWKLEETRISCYKKILR